MLGGSIWRPRDGIGLEHHAVVIFVIFQGRIRLYCQRLAIMSTRVNVHRDHVRPLFEVFLAFGREFMLMIHRPAVQITDAAENERGLRWCASGVGVPSVEQATGDSYRDRNPKRMNFHSFQGSDFFRSGVKILVIKLEALQD